MNPAPFTMFYNSSFENKEIRDFLVILAKSLTKKGVG